MPWSLNIDAGPRSCDIPRSVLKEGGKYDPHDYSYDYPPPYIPRRYTFEIDERVDAQGNVVRPLDQNQAREVVRMLAQRNFEAVAVCLLWSIANGEP